ncbi:MAG: hypothetical protein ACOVO1_09060 [Chitinophagaceae bacterium]
MIYFKVIFIALISIIVLTSCKKEVNKDGVNTMLYHENINNVKKKESISLTFGNDDITSKVIWSVTPNNDCSIISVANNATLIFNQAGTYNVTATLGSVYAVYTITVDNMDFVPNYGTDFIMTSSKLVNIAINEPIVFSVNNSQTGNNITWSVISKSYSIIRNDVLKTATITFTSDGFGVVTASDGINTQRRTVWVSDTINSNTDTVPFMLEDKLVLKPLVEQTSSGKKLVILASTLKKYHCNSDRILSYSSNGEYIIDYSGIVVAAEPCNPRSVATCTNSFKNVAIGTHPFVINFGNKTYIGSFNLDAFGTFTFNWQNTNDVYFSSLIAK